ncbi:MAG: hypothetical protein M3235_13570 [Actinomycetota bacterium]|nr:hypothetical protein [Actinomycetota bacterium]
MRSSEDDDPRTVTGGLTNRLGSRARLTEIHGKYVNEISSAHPIWLHALDALRHRVATGDLVRLNTSIGYLVGRVWVTTGIHAGVCARSHHMGRRRLHVTEGSCRVQAWPTSLPRSRGGEPTARRRWSNAHWISPASRLYSSAISIPGILIRAAVRPDGAMAVIDDAESATVAAAKPAAPARSHSPCRPPSRSSARVISSARGTTSPSPGTPRHLRPGREHGTRRSPNSRRTRSADINCRTFLDWLASLLTSRRTDQHAR